jgi:hypothetical protein
LAQVKTLLIPDSAAKLLLCQQFQSDLGICCLDARKKQIPRAKNARGMTVSWMDSGSRACQTDPLPVKLATDVFGRESLSPSYTRKENRDDHQHYYSGIEYKLARVR